MHVQRTDASRSKTLDRNDLRERSNHNQVWTKSPDLSDANAWSIETRERIFLASKRPPQELAETCGRFGHDNGGEMVIARDTPHGGLRLRAATGKSNHRQYGHAGDAVENRSAKLEPLSCAASRRRSGAVAGSLPFPGRAKDHILSCA